MMKKYKVTVNGSVYEITVEALGANETVEYTKNEAKKAEPAPVKESAGDTKIASPLPGNVISISVSEGAKVNKGDVLMVLEALKMENEILATESGTVKSINVSKGQTVETGALLCVIG